MDAKTLHDFIEDADLRHIYANILQSNRETMLSALSLAAAVEGPEEATPETDASLIDIDGKRYVPNGCAELLAVARTLERQRNAALRALKAERERVAQFESERLPFPVLIRDTNFGKGVKVGTMLGCLKRHIEWNKPDIGPDAALAAQEGRHD